MSKRLGFTVEKVKGYKLIKINDGALYEHNGIRVYLIDTDCKHCEISGISDNRFGVTWGGDPKCFCYLKFDVPDGYEMHPEVNRYTIVVRMIPKVDYSTAPSRNISRYGKSNVFYVNRRMMVV